MWVVKLGGSLQDGPFLRDWIRAIASHGGGKMVLVPGGGKYADKVRQDQILEGFSDREAHSRAIAAMERFAADLCESEPRLRPFTSRAELAAVLRTGGVPVWLPGEMVIGRQDLPESWGVTSDSLALWLVNDIQADGLVLIKSVPLPGKGVSVATLSESGLLDDYFPTLFRHHPVKLGWLTMRDLEQIKSTLTSGGLPDSTRLSEPSLEGAVVLT